jgi:hypothetical protein
MSFSIGIAFVFGVCQSNILVLCQLSPQSFKKHMFYARVSMDRDSLCVLEQVRFVD